MCADVELLNVCDAVRDVDLPELGVMMEDKEDHTVVKVVGREAALRERQAAKEVRGHLYGYQYPAPSLCMLLPLPSTSFHCIGITIATDHTHTAHVTGPRREGEGKG